MSFKFLGTEPPLSGMDMIDESGKYPKVNLVTAKRLLKQKEHFRGALKEAAFELERETLWGKNYTHKDQAKWIASLLRVSAGED